MLFLQDNLQIKSSSYAIVPFIDFKNSTALLDHLKNLQSVVAYIYAAPRHEFGDLFLSYEHASMAIFSPGKVLESLLGSDSHVTQVGPVSRLATNSRKEVDGYTGLYNFRHHFWVAKGSRLYGPNPRLTLNIAQDLMNDFAHVVNSRSDHRSLNALLCKPSTLSSSQIFTAIRWFNSACNDANEEDTAIVNLSIAFEALLRLPRDKKTNRFVDSISLLLNRTPRLDIWAHQFYEARSNIVHEGYTKQFHFIAKDSKNGNSYQSLLSYGRQVFQLCLATILFGAELSEKFGLEDKLITNQERFEEICKVLSTPKIGAIERLECIESIIANIQRYRYIPESNLDVKTMIGATCLATKALLEHNEGMNQELKIKLETLINTQSSKDHFQEYEALQKIVLILDERPEYTGTNGGNIFRSLVNAVWGYVFMFYFSLEKQK